LQIPNLMLSTIGLIWLSFMPETPRFLFSMNRMDETRAAFNFIAKYNGKDLLDDSVTFCRESESSFVYLDANYSDDQRMEY
jgi:hypothetical protein